MNAPIMDVVTVTANYTPLSSVSLRGTFDITCLPANVAVVNFLGLSSHDVPWAAGEFHGPFRDVDLKDIQIKGTPGDKVTIEIYPLKSGEPGGSFIEVTKSDGSKLYYHG